MIAFLKGTIANISEGQVVIETNGLGYICYVPNNVASSLKTDEEAKIITHMVVREDDISLYGFLTYQDKDLFLRLLSISGVGAKVALSILSGLSGDRLIEALASGDTAALSSIKGIGKKTAERIVLELKDKVSADFGDSMRGIISATGTFVPVSSATNEAITALVSLGYSKAEAARSVASIGGIENLSVEEILLKALKG